MPDRLKAIAEHWITPDAVSKTDLETALLRMNDHPGVTARARLVPGKAAGTSRLVVDVEQAPLLGGAVWADNYGQASTGRTQGSGFVTVTDATGLGDETRLLLSKAEGLTSGQIEVSAPLSANGPKATLSYGLLDYRNIDELGKAAGLKGYAHRAGLRLSHAIMRSRAVNLRAELGGNWKALVDDSSAGRLQDKRVRSGTAALSGDMWDSVLAGGFTRWRLSWTYGDLDLSRVPSALAADAAGLRTDGRFQRANASVMRLQDLGGGIALLGRLQGQWAGGNLDSSEDFALGGPYGVRAYPANEGRGDMGYVATVEVRYGLPAVPLGGAAELSGFIDSGRVRVNRDPNGVPNTNACGCNSYSLHGAGVGLRWNSEWAGLSVSYAHALGHNPGRGLDGRNADGRRQDEQVWMQASIRF